MQRMTTIAVDAMTCERGVASVVSAVLSAASIHKQLSFVLVGDTEQIKSVVPNGLPESVSIKHAAHTIKHSDNPVNAMRKQGSSTHETLKLVKEKNADAAVSCANTGALMGLSRFFLKRLPGVQQLALAARYPTYNLDRDIMLADVGASMDMLPIHLWQIARLLTLYTTENIKDAKGPSVGVLSVGAEAGKGNALVKSLVPMLRYDKQLRYIGLVEPRDLYLGKADIVLCDGFVGNAVLKASEATGRFVQDLTKQALSSRLGMIVGCALKPFLKPFQMKLSPEKRNGGLVLGVNGVVIKSHGNSCSTGVLAAIEFAIKALNAQTHHRLNSFSLLEIPEPILD